MDDSPFADELRKEVVSVPRAGLLFARAIAYPHLEVAHYLEQLDELAGEARAALDEGAAPVALANFLFQRRFRGNVASYEDPRNSYLNDVLERQLGIPISLSVIYIAVARKLGLEAYGISLPGHFVVGVRFGADEMLLDPFNKGERLVLADCRRLVRETTGYQGVLQPEWLDPATPRAILGRMLNNLRLIYLRREQWPEALAVLEHLRLVQPSVADHLRDLGLIYYQLGEMYEAAHYLERYLKLAPDTPEAVAILQNLRPDFGRWARLN